MNAAEFILKKQEGYRDVAWGRSVRVDSKCLFLLTLFC
jgi:hypothetical protein